MLDVQTGAKQMLPIPGKPPASFELLRFSPDSKSVYMGTDANGEFKQLARLNLETMQYTWLSESIPWDVDAIQVDPGSGRVAFTVDEDGASALYLLDRDELIRLEHPSGVITGLDFSPDGSRLGFTLARYDAPPDVYSITLGDHKLERWTYSEVGGLDPATFVAPSPIRFVSFDGRKIPAYIYRPRGALHEKPVPVLISIHGGPESQYRPFFSGLEQFFVNDLGFAVIAPNVRGSAGYGKTYLKLDNAEKREDSVRDIGGLLDWIATQPDLDAKRVAVMGGSYGGYMVLASLTHYSDRIRAGVDIVGVASFNTMLKTTSAYRRDLRRAEYGDERDAKMQAFFCRTDPLNRRGQHPFGAAGRSRTQRSTSSVYGGRANRGESSRERKHRLDRVRGQRRSRLSEESESRLSERRDRDLLETQSWTIGRHFFASGHILVVVRIKPRLWVARIRADRSIHKIWQILCPQS